MRRSSQIGGYETVTDTLPDDLGPENIETEGSGVLLDELRRLSPVLYARFIAQCRTVVVNLVLEEDRMESHGSRRSGGLTNEEGG
jgi:hypothetical protein